MTSIDLTETPTDLDQDDDLEALTILPKVPLEEEIIARASANHEPMPMLDVIFSRLGTSLSPMLKSQNGFLSECSTPRVDYFPWGSVIEGLDPNGAAAMAKSTWGGSIALAIDAAFLHAGLIHMMGGKPSNADVARRAPTTLEKAFAHRLMGQLLTELSHQFARITEVDFTLDTVEAPTQLSSFLASGALTAVCEIDIEIGPIIGRASIILPMQTLEPARAQLSKMFLGEKLGGDVSWRDHFEGQISGATMTLAVELHRLSVPLADVLGWRPGVTLDLGITAEQEATVICSGRPILHGATGRRRNGRIALRVTREYTDSEGRADDDDLIAD